MFARKFRRVFKKRIWFSKQEFIVLLKTNRITDNSNRITENLARLADGLANISIKIEKVDNDLAFHSIMDACDLKNISAKIERVESDLVYHSNMVVDDMAKVSIKIDSAAGDLAKVSSRIENVEVNLKEITVSYLEKPFSMHNLGNFTIEYQKMKKVKKSCSLAITAYENKCQKRILKTKKISWRLITKVLILEKTRQQNKKLMFEI